MAKIEKLKNAKIPMFSAAFCTKSSKKPSPRPPGPGRPQNSNFCHFTIRAQIRNLQGRLPPFGSVTNQFHSKTYQKSSFLQFQFFRQEIKYTGSISPSLASHKLISCLKSIQKHTKTPFLEHEVLRQEIKSRG